MATNLNNNIHINSFTKGMNTDTSLDMVSNELYVFGQNIRITGNALLGALIDSNNKENVVTPVPSGITSNYINKAPKYCKILATASIENVGAVIVADVTGSWYVYRVDCNNNALTFNHIYSGTNPTDQDRFSVVINKEQDKITKLYIADGIHEIMMINLDCFQTGTDYTYYQDKDDDDLISNRLYPDTALTISELISGKLKTQQLQYTYRFYKKHGICSRPAPLTSKIQVIDGNRNRENGNAADTETTIGFKLKIPYSYTDIFDYVLLYRISYTKPNTDAEINLILDVKINAVDGYITINDTGLESLQTLSPEEFAALTDLNIVPQCIELNQNYLFAANTEDLTVLRLNSNLTISDIVTGWEYISIHIPIHSGYVPDDYTYQNIPNINDYVKDDSDQKIFGISTSNFSEYDTGETITSYLKQHNLYTPDTITYNDLMISSMFRSLRRDETYRYGIVLYDKYGKRTNTYHIADITTPTEYEYSMTCTRPDASGNTILYARPLGVRFDVTLPSEFSSYLIVRCAKKPEYTKNLLQCVLSRPLRQPLVNTTGTYDKVKDTSGEYIITNQNTNTSSSSLYSPYYPQQFLTSNYYRYWSGSPDTYYLGNANNFNNHLLFLIFNPQINVQRSDLSSTLSSKDLKITPVSYLYGNNLLQDFYRVTDVGYKWAYPIVGTISGVNAKTENVHLFSKSSSSEIGVATKYIQYLYSANLIIPGKTDDDLFFTHIRDLSAIYKKHKQEVANVFYYYNKYNSVDHTTVDIKNVSDVLNPTWEEGWDNLSFDSDNSSLVADGSKTYKGFTSTIGNFSYVNWVCSNLYDLQIGTTQDHADDSDEDLRGKQSVYNCDRSPAKAYGNGIVLYACGCQGPGPVCFLIELSDKDADSNDAVQFLKSTLLSDNSLINGTLLCNIQHSYTKYAGETAAEMQYDIYYGFGNFSKETRYMVFDGDVYITPCEIVTMFKTYDFQSYYSLMSNQFVYYVPMETVINTYFDYGMNYMNTLNKNLQLEPGDITGVSVQDRPITQYNLIYSDNNVSNDIYNTESLEETENTYTQRIHYSELKTNGENIDSWMDFKSLNYIDADTRWGDITNLLTVKDIIYYWQTLAFGKLSVNERSLVTDNNSNTIQLGQGGVLQRTDYIDTKHGMRAQDFSAISAEGIVYWIDMVNKAVVQSDGQKVLNYSEIVNVLNIVNRSIDYSYRPCIDYDIQNNELMCKFLHDGTQLIFNIKLNCATSIYTRLYDDIIYFNNIIFGINQLLYTQHNYLNSTDDYLTPTELSFVVNPNSSTTKVFDDQEVVTLYRGNFIDDNNFMEGKYYTFNTNLYENKNIQPDGSTDREGNVRYAIPRTENEIYGNRMRGKWLQVDIVDNKPRYKQSISHILTKFRQSFS